MTKHYQILIIGGGTAGIMTAAQLLRQKVSKSIAIIEPADKHYYQPAWTLVGAGTHDFDETAKPLSKMIPKLAVCSKDKATHVEAHKIIVSTSDNGVITYVYLVVAPGLADDFSVVPALGEAMDNGVVFSN